MCTAMIRIKSSTDARTRPQKGGNDLSADTRGRLLEAGLRQFGRSGLDGVSTRQLAEAAGVNLAAIPYHFGGKEGLYLAVAKHLVDGRAAPARQLVESLQRSLRSTEVGPDRATAMLRELIATLGRTVLLAPEATDMIGYLSREQLHPTAAFDVVYEGFIRPVHETLALLVARVQGKAAPDRRAIIRAHAIVGQILAFHIGRETALRRLEWDAYTLARLEELIAEITDFVFQGLGVPGVVRPAPKSRGQMSRRSR